MCTLSKATVLLTTTTTTTKSYLSHSAKKNVLPYLTIAVPKTTSNKINIHSTNI